MTTEAKPVEVFKSLLIKLLERTAVGDEEGIAQVRPQINNEYWNAVLQLAEEIVPEPPFQPNLQYDRRQILFAGYGIAGFGLFDWEADLSARLADESKPRGEYEIRLIPNAMNDAYRAALGLDKRMDVKLQQSRVDYQIELTVQYIRDMQAHCAALIQKYLNKADAEEMMQISSVYDERIRPILTMEKQIKERGMSKKEDITRFAQMKEEVEQVRARRDQLLSRTDKGKKILDAFLKVERGYVKLLDLNSRAVQVKKDMEKTRRVVSRVDLISSVKDEIKHLKMLMNMTSQLCRMVPMSVPLSDLSLATPGLIAEAMDKIVDFDPDVFHNRHGKRDGIPHVLIVPGTGNGMYDWSKNRLVIPSLSARNVLENVATAVVMYRLDVDQQFSDRKLIQSYKNEIKANREVRSIRKLRQILVENYVTWISKEAEGYAVLDREVREWFEQNIGPKKNNVIIPKTLRGLTLSEINTKLENFSKRPPHERTAQDFYELGVMFAMKEEFKEAANFFAQTISVDPDFVNAYYSGGICFRKSHDKRGVEFLTEFVKRAPQSWWSKKAQEMVSKGS